LYIEIRRCYWFSTLPLGYNYGDCKDIKTKEGSTEERRELVDWIKKNKTQPFVVYK
jgi:hypothetical protein